MSIEILINNKWRRKTIKNNSGRQRGLKMNDIFYNSHNQKKQKQCC